MAQRHSYKVTMQSNHNLPVARNLLDQDFTAEQPNKIWLSIREHAKAALFDYV